MSSFVYDSTTLAFSVQPIYPYIKLTERIQVSGRYLSTPCSYNKSLRADTFYILQFEYLPESEFEALIVFKNLVSQVNPFTWNDDTSGTNVVRTVKFDHGNLLWAYSSYNTIRCNLKLKI